MTRPSALIVLLAGTSLATPALAQQQSCDQRLQALEQRAREAPLSSQQQGEVNQMLESARLFQRIQREEGCLNVLAEVERMLPAQQGGEQAQVGQQGLQQAEPAGVVDDPLARARQALQEEQAGQPAGESVQPSQERPVVVIRLPQPEITVRLPGSDQEVQAEVRFELMEPDMAGQQPAAGIGRGQGGMSALAGDQEPATVGDRQPPAGIATSGGGEQAMAGPAQAGGPAGQGQAPAARTSEQQGDLGAPAAEQTLQEPAQAADQVAQSEADEGEADMAGDQDVQSAQQGGGEQQQEQIADQVAGGSGAVANVQGGVTGAGDNPPASAADPAEAAQTARSAQQQQVGTGAGSRQDGQDQPAAAAVDQNQPELQGVTGGGLRADRQQPDDSQADQAAGPPISAGGPAMVAGLPVEQVIGEEVENQAGEAVGTVVDLVRQSSDQALFAVLSVGGFLGIGDKDVAIAADQFEVGADQNLLLPEATEESLEEAPPYNHALFESVIDQQ